MREHSAGDEPLELSAHEAGERRGETFFRRGVERAEVVSHHLMERALFWTAPRVAVR
jgi:hypothetical protein